MKHLNPKQRRLLLLAAIALWLISLPLPVFIFDQNHDYDGITTLLLGTIFGFAMGKLAIMPCTPTISGCSSSLP